MTEPGWRADPTGRFQLRWFDGRRWTRRVRVGDAEAVDTVSVPNDLQPPAPTRSGEPPGYRSDPEDPSQERFWDGQAWTAATRPRRTGRRDQPGRRAWPVPRILTIGLVVLAIVVAAVITVVVLT
jgi:hypothetical protein